MHGPWARFRDAAPRPYKQDARHLPLDTWMHEVTLVSMVGLIKARALTVELWLPKRVMPGAHQACAISAVIAVALSSLLSFALLRPSFFPQQAAVSRARFSIILHIRFHGACHPCVCGPGGRHIANIAFVSRTQRMQTTISISRL